LKAEFSKIGLSERDSAGTRATCYLLRWSPCLMGQSPFQREAKSLSNTVR